MIATASYDAFRYLIIVVFHLLYWPWDTITLFGQAIVGPSAPEELIQAAGYAYHVVNGVGFAVAYTVLFGRRGIVAGVVWAMGLETLMVSFFPGWLGLKALGEFL